MAEILKCEICKSLQEGVFEAVLNRERGFGMPEAERRVWLCTACWVDVLEVWDRLFGDYDLLGELKERFDAVDD